LYQDQQQQQQQQQAAVKLVMEVVKEIVEVRVREPVEEPVEEGRRRRLAITSFGRILPHMRRFYHLPSLLRLAILL